MKTLSDPEASRVSLRPRRSTVDALRRLPPPVVGRNTPRQPGVETRAFRIRARLVGMKLEDDRDVHLVVADLEHPAETMIVELPDPSCTGGASPSNRAAMSRARAALTRACGAAGAAWRTLRGTATIVGVGFFDVIHGQTGVAPNGIELHPVLAFASSDCG